MTASTTESSPRAADGPDAAPAVALDMAPAPASASAPAPVGAGAGRFLELRVTDADRRIARYATAAIALAVAESALPTPLPGVKPGLANIVVLIVLTRHGWRDAAWVAILRVLAGSLLIGQFLAPGFFLALAGALTSLLALAVAVRLPSALFGPVTASLLAAFAHIAGQLAVARLWLVPHDGLYYLVPIFAASALIFGIVNGLVAARLLKENG